MTNLAIFDTKSKAEKGAWLHLENPETGDLMFADEEQTKPMRIKLLGANSDKFEKIKMAAMRKARNKKKVKLSDSEELKAAVLEVSEMYAKMTLETENLSDKPFTHEETIQMYIQYLDIRKQVGQFIGSDENFTQS